jgi:hypothetical protein
MKNNAPETPVSMPLDHAREELADQVRIFCNYMLHLGVTGLHPDNWMHRFQEWQNRNPLSRQYASTIRAMESKEMPE